MMVTDYIGELSWWSSSADGSHNALLALWLVSELTTGAAKSDCFLNDFLRSWCFRYVFIDHNDMKKWLLQSSIIFGVYSYQLVFKTDYPHAGWLLHFAVPLISNLLFCYDASLLIIYISIHRYEFPKITNLPQDFIEKQSRGIIKSSTHQSSNLQDPNGLHLRWTLPTDTLWDDLRIAGRPIEGPG